MQFGKFWKWQINKANKLGKRYIGSVRYRNKTKIFCVGRNKTGTTSLKKALINLGFSVGDQREAERLADSYYFEGHFDPIIRYCQSAQAFQDVPFSWPETYKVLDEAFPGSKFILTIRDNPEEWYWSLVNFHSKLFGQAGKTPTAADLKKASYVRKGFMYNILRVYGTRENDPYNKDAMIASYLDHNEDVKDHFRGRGCQLLVLNVAENGAYQKLLDFLGCEASDKEFPWENKT